ncbi:MAG TPA: methyltransferase domain-containing protein [Chloroflexota bacterium]|nr:methyltransferase domain-containing protein [Chloroflexota bacterium]
MSRWARARRLLRVAPGSRVLDLGCAFGFGTRLLVPEYHAFGHDLSAPYIDRARRALPRAIFTRGPADRIPHPDGFFDAVLLLDVLEHVPEEGPVVAEIARVLRPGGQLILSVPNKGLLAPLDSLNLYRRLARSGAPPPTDDPSWPVSPVHRHYCLRDVQSLLEPRFAVRRAWYSGLGIAETVNLALLLAFRDRLNLPRIYGIAQYLYFALYLLEDLLPMGPAGYHLMVEATRN